jgi:competence protein ComEA
LQTGLSIHSFVWMSKRKKIKSGWTDYFNFSARERRGTALLTFIILSEIIVLNFLNHYQTPIPPPDPELVKAVLALNEPRSSFRENSNKRDSTPQVNFHPLSFNPNNITTEIALSAGLSEKQSKVILNYVSKGGVFRTKNDFKKMYCIPEKQFEKLKPFLLLPDSFSVPKKPKQERKYFLVDINRADSLTLIQIKGIGPVFSSRIIKYRDKLGGFIAVAQLKEVYGMRDSLYDAILPSIILHDSMPLRYIHLNTDTITLLAAHPYIRWKLANVIVNYRKQHLIQSVEEIRSMPMVNEETYLKLYKYLKID